MLLFLSVGYGTTSTSLVRFIFFITKYTHAQNKIKQELSEYGRQGLPTEQLVSLVYLESVLQEVLRFVPLAIGAIRTLVADDQLPATDVY